MREKEIEETGKGNVWKERGRKKKKEETSKQILNKLVINVK